MLPVHASRAREYTTADVRDELIHHVEPRHPVVDLLNGTPLETDE
jgi:hypothetical protein